MKKGRGRREGKEGKEDMKKQGSRKVDGEIKYARK